MGAHPAGARRQGPLKNPPCHPVPASQADAAHRLTFAAGTIDLSMTDPINEPHRRLLPGPQAPHMLARARAHDSLFAPAGLLMHAIRVPPHSSRSYSARSAPPSLGPRRRGARRRGSGLPPPAGCLSTRSACGSDGASESHGRRIDYLPVPSAPARPPSPFPRA